MTLSAGGPGPVVFAYFDAMEAGDFDVAWALIEDTHRRCIVQYWLWHHRDAFGPQTLEARCAALLDRAPHDELWPDFVRAQRVAWKQSEFHLRGPSKWAIGSATRAFGPDLELVILVDTDGEALLFTEATAVPSHQFVMKLGPDGWRIASFLPTLPQPGWPPVMDDRPDG